MDELINLRGKTRYIDISKDIGVQGYKVGTVLLKDATSTVVPAIEKEYGHKTERVNFEILRQENFITIPVKHTVYTTCHKCNVYSMGLNLQ